MHPVAGHPRHPRWHGSSPAAAAHSGNSLVLTPRSAKEGSYRRKGTHSRLRSLTAGAACGLSVLRPGNGHQHSPNQEGRD